ncbi:MAG: RNA polymerase sigma factor [Dermatophilaceae bacterium]
MNVGEIVAAESTATGAYPRIVAAILARTADWSLAEDCAQEAITRALDRWPKTGVPDNPGGWLMRVALNLAIDAQRRHSTTQAAVADLATLTQTIASTPPGHLGLSDDRLRLVFTCCHPALSMETRVGLTLRTVCGVATSAIARALHVKESTMTRRLTRAKAKIAEAGIPYEVPTDAALGERLPGVLAVIYLLFTDGHDSAGHPPFAWEALRLARLVTELLDDGEANALLALILLTHARQSARRDANGGLIGLEDQDRRRWDQVMIAEGLSRVALLASGAPYAIQAKIAAEHAIASSWEVTDWPTIVGLYDELYAIRPDPVVGLNRAIATGHGVSPTAGLALLRRVRNDGQLINQPTLDAAEGHLTALSGDVGRAVVLFRCAAATADDNTTRLALTRRANELEQLRSVTTEGCNDPER